MRYIPDEYVLPACVLRVKDTRKSCKTRTLDLTIPRSDYELSHSHICKRKKNENRAAQLRMLPKRMFLVRTRLT